MAASWMELPKTASGEGTPARRREATLPSSVGTSVRVSVTSPLTICTRAERTRLAGMLNRWTPSSMTQSLVELTAQISTLRLRSSSTRASISGKMFFSMRVWKKTRAAPSHLLFAEATCCISTIWPQMSRFGDFATEVATVFGVDPVGCVAGDEAGLDAPVHEARAGVTGPEGAVAVEDGYFGGEVEDGLVEFCGGERDWEDLWHGGSAFLRGCSAR